jgi:hypothetical protein
MAAKEPGRVKQSRTIKLDPILDRLIYHYGVKDTVVCDVLAGLGLLDQSKLISRNKYGTLIEHTVYTSTDKLRKLIKEEPSVNIIFSNGDVPLEPMS